MIEKNFIEIEGTFLQKIHYNAFEGINGENVFEHINSFLEVVEPLKIRGLIERFVQKFYNLFDHDEDEEAEDDDNPDEIDNVPKIFKIEDNFSDINGYCNGGELLGMVRIGRMTYFQDHKWYDSLIDGCLKEETLIHKARIEGSWGDATPGVMKFCTWLKDSFENFHKLDYDDNQLRGPYANAEPNRTFDPYLDNDCISKRNYETNNVINVQDGKGHMENLTHESSACKIKRLKMMKYTFEADEEYVAIKEIDHINHSETNMDARYAYREFFAKWMIDGSNYGVFCEDEAKRRNSKTKTKTFEENSYLLPYAVSSKEGAAYQRQLITRIRLKINSRFGVSLLTPYAMCPASRQSKICS
ncbi:hypothetical protein Tco_0613827 [Tanacetum coccineum]